MNSTSRFTQCARFLVVSAMALNFLATTLGLASNEPPYSLQKSILEPWHSSDSDSAKPAPIVNMMAQTQFTQFYTVVAPPIPAWALALPQTFEAKCSAKIKLGSDQLFVQPGMLIDSAMAGSPANGNLNQPYCKANLSFSATDLLLASSSKSQSGLGEIEFTPGTYQFNSPEVDDNAVDFFGTQGTYVKFSLSQFTPSIPGAASSDATVERVNCFIPFYSSVTDPQGLGPKAVTTLSDFENELSKLCPVLQTP